MVKKINGVELLSVPELAKKLGVSVRTVYSYIHETRVLPAVQIGRAWYVSTEGLHAFLHGQTRPAKQEKPARRARKKK